MVFIVGSGSLVKIADSGNDYRQEVAPGWVAPAAVLGGATAGGLGMRALNLGGRLGVAAYGLSGMDPLAEGATKYYIRNGTLGKKPFTLSGTDQGFKRLGKGGKIIRTIAKTKPYMIGAGMIGGGIAAYKGLKNLSSKNRDER